MTFLPIVERELRVAARKRNTFWLRIIAALVALVIAGGFLVLAMTLPSGATLFGMTHLGRVLFGLLTWMSLVAALSAGLFFTSDCVSEEKREGTLGFLFLTDLRGYDVVLGKLLSTSLRCFFALLAIFPILAITMLMGGVAAPQFWKTILALVNSLFCSLAVGMFISAISRDSQKALAGTLLLLLLLVFAGPMIDGIVAGVSNRTFRPFFSLCSPGFVFLWTDRWGETFWLGLLTNQILVWLLLALACVLVPRTWQQRRTRNTVSHGTWSYAWRYGGTKRRLSLRQRLMSRSPVLWLACRERWQSLVIWMVAIFALISFLICLPFDLPMGAWVFAHYVGNALILIIYLGTASQAGRFFVEARRSGLIEMLLAAPLTGREIVQGQWRALLRLFALPVTLFLCVQFVATMFSQHASASTMFGGIPSLAQVLIVAISVAALTAANLIALCWFGMWMGMTSRSANFATLKTILFVQVIPWIVIYFVSAMLTYLVFIPTMVRSMGGANPAAVSGRFAWFPLVFSAASWILFIGKDVLFTLLARRKLYSQFRELAVRTTAPVHPVVIAPPRPVAAPPMAAARS